jgi:hypothetical protein
MELVSAAGQTARLNLARHVSRGKAAGEVVGSQLTAAPSRCARARELATAAFNL